MNINDKVVQELKALAECGVKVSEEVMEAARGDLSEYDNMSISNLADLLILLHSTDGE